MATATAATARSAGRWCGGRGRSAISVSARCAKYGKLNGIFRSGALGAGNFLILIQDNSFEGRFAIVASVFVNGHDFPIRMRISASWGGRGFPWLLTTPSRL
jgi:hypothetical protein